MENKYGRVYAIGGIIVFLIVFFFGAFIQEKGWLKWTGVSAEDILLWCLIALGGFVVGSLMMRVTTKKNGK